MFRKITGTHWHGRVSRRRMGGKRLLSWSGTMFEYLMPLIFMRSYDHSLLDHACREAVRQQIEFGRTNAVPWGVSESAYSALDANQIYQYRAFGIPGLALSPGRDEDLVVAPYATMLALLVDPAAAIANLRRLETVHLEGPMGFYESIDFGLENQEDGERGVPVYAYMAHHQGMSLMALDEILHRDMHAATVPLRRPHPRCRIAPVRAYSHYASGHRGESAEPHGGPAWSRARNRPSGPGAKTR